MSGRVIVKYSSAFLKLWNSYAVHDAMNLNKTASIEKIETCLYHNIFSIIPGFFSYKLTIHDQSTMFVVILVAKWALTQNAWRKKTRQQ